MCEETSSIAYHSVGSFSVIINQINYKKIQKFKMFQASEVIPQKVATIANQVIYKLMPKEYTKRYKVFITLSKLVEKKKQCYK